MHRTRALSSLALSVAFAALPACSTPKPEPEIISSSPHGGYAETYPAQLNAAVSGFGDVQNEAHKIEGELPSYPGKLKDPDWGKVLEIVERADEDGHGYLYVERMRRVERAGVFFEAEKDEITKKVAGAVQYAAKQKGCDVEVSGVAAAALKDSVNKQIEKELHEASEAQRAIERYRGQLGKENAAALEKQADAIARASYLVRIELVEIKLRVMRMAAEAEEIKRTADATIAAERAYLGENKKATDAEKKAAEARIAALEKSKASIDSASQQASSLLPRLDQEVQKAQKEYVDALEALKNTLREKKK
jgi:hypothetical protein